MNDKTRTAHSDRLQRRATLGGYPWIAHVARSSYSALSLESLAKFHRKRHTRTRWGAASRFSLRSKVPFEASLLRCYDSRTLCGLACAPRTSLAPWRRLHRNRPTFVESRPPLMPRPGMVLSIYCRDVPFISSCRLKMLRRRFQGRGSSGRTEPCPSCQSERSKT